MAFTREERLRRARVAIREEIDELGLSVRAYNCLMNARVMTVAELVKRSEGELLGFVGLGEDTLADIKKKLARVGLKLNMTTDGVIALLRPST